MGGVGFSQMPVKAQSAIKTLGACLGDSNTNLRLEDFPSIPPYDLKVWLEVSKLATEPLMTMDELEKELAECHT